MIETLAPAPVTPERVTPMKPSEALRLGRLTRPRRSSGEFFDGTDGACALGAIAEAVGMKPADDGSDPYCDLTSRWPALTADAACPSPGSTFVCDSPGDLMDVIYHLNDQHHWSDDQIVTWLESLGL